MTEDTPGGSKSLGHPFSPRVPAVFPLIYCCASPYKIHWDFRVDSLGRGGMFVGGEGREIEGQLVFDGRKKTLQKFSYSLAFLSLHLAHDIWM